MAGSNIIPFTPKEQAPKGVEMNKAALFFYHHRWKESKIFATQIMHCWRKAVQEVDESSIAGRTPTLTYASKQMKDNGLYFEAQINTLENRLQIWIKSENSSPATKD